MDEKKEKFNIQKLIRQNPVLGILSMLAVGFVAGLSAYELFLKFSDRYMRKDYVLENFVEKVDCLNKIKYVYLVDGDSTTSLTTEEKTALNNKVRSIEEIIVPESEVDFSNMTEEQKYKYTIALGRLDQLYGQLLIINRIINGANIKTLNDSLTRDFDQKFKEVEEYEK